MADAPRISLEQWRALAAVVEAGGYTRAAEALHKTQSTLTYAVQKIERLLDLKVFEIRGRKAVLTEAGQVLYRRARTLLEEAALLERGAAAMSQHWQPEIGIAVEILFPTWLLVDCLGEFARELAQAVDQEPRGEEDLDRDPDLGLPVLRHRRGAALEQRGLFQQGARATVEDLARLREHRLSPADLEDLQVQQALDLLHRVSERRLGLVQRLGGPGV